jgi:small subunit ribosomal protein S6
MGDTGLVEKYELVVIVDAKLTNEEKDNICKEVIESVSKGGGKVINSQTWLEKQKFTFRIKKLSEGTYYLINFEGESPAIDKIRSNLKLNEKVLRFAITKAE